MSEEKKSIINQLKNEEIVINRDNKNNFGTGLVFRNYKEKVIKNYKNINEKIQNYKNIEKVVTAEINNFHGRITGLGCIGNNVFVSHGSNNGKVYHNIDMYDRNLNIINSFSKYLENGKNMSDFIEGSIKQVLSLKNRFYISSINRNKPLFIFNQKMNLESCISVRNRGNGLSIGDNYILTSDTSKIYFHRALERKNDGLPMPKMTTIADFEQPTGISAVYITPDDKNILVAYSNALRTFNVDYSECNISINNMKEEKRENAIKDFSLSNYLAISEGNNLVILDNDFNEIANYFHKNQIEKVATAGKYTVSVDKKGVLNLYKS